MKLGSLWDGLRRLLGISPNPERHRLPVIRGQRLVPVQRKPELSDEESARRWLQHAPRPWAIDLFCGAGGLSLGLQQAGLSVVASVDQDATALETHRANIGGLTWQGDLSEPEPFISFLADRGVDEVDVVAGGPPCQPFSRAGKAKIRSLVANGKRPESDPRVRAWQAYAEVVRSLRPRVVLLENVPDMARWQDGEVLAEIHGMLRALGYQPHTRMLQGEEMGVPQHRMRLFIVGVRSGIFTWPRRRSPVSLRDAIADLPKLDPGDRVNPLAYGSPRSTFQRRARRGVPRREADLVFDHVVRDVRKDDREAFELLAEGQTYAHLPHRLQRYRSDIFRDKYKRLSWDSVSRTITAHIAKDGYWYIHPDQPRTLSIREAARVQTFPDWFRFAGHPTTQFRQIGNAVPPVLARAVGLRVVSCLNGDVTRNPPERGEVLLAWRNTRVGEGSVKTPDPWNLAVTAVVLGVRDWELAQRRAAPLLALASNPAATVNGNWRGVRRALWQMGREDRIGSLRRLAQTVADSPSGLPTTESELAQLPGLSRHAAAWIASASMARDAVVLDAATRRVASRVSGRSLSSDWDARLEVIELAGRVGPTPAFNEAVRLVGREICTPRNPRCSECPIAAGCASSTVAAAAG